MWMCRFFSSKQSPEFGFGHIIRGFRKWAQSQNATCTDWFLRWFIRSVYCIFSLPYFVISIANTYEGYIINHDFWIIYPRDSYQLSSCPYLTISNQQLQACSTIYIQPLISGVPKMGTPIAGWSWKIPIEMDDEQGIALF